VLDPPVAPLPHPNGGRQPWQVGMLAFLAADPAGGLLWQWHTSPKGAQARRRSAPDLPDAFRLLNDCCSVPCRAAPCRRGRDAFPALVHDVAGGVSALEARKFRRNS